MPLIRTGIKYGEENARYLMETLGDHLRNYSKLAYVDTDLQLSKAYQAEAMALATEKTWEFSEIKGSTRLILNMMNGAWDESDFLVVKPGQTIQASYDDDVIKSEEASGPSQ